MSICIDDRDSDQKARLFLITFGLLFGCVMFIGGYAFKTFEYIVDGESRQIKEQRMIASGGMFKGNN